MALLTWGDKYRVSMKEIDDQHRKLIDLLNDLHAAMKYSHFFNQKGLK